MTIGWVLNLLLPLFFAGALARPLFSPTVPTPHGVLTRCGSYFSLSTFYSAQTRSSYLSHGAGGCQGCSSGEGYAPIRVEGFAYSSPCSAALNCSQLVTYFSKARGINLVVPLGFGPIPADFSPWAGNAAWVLPLGGSGGAASATLELWQLGETDFWSLAADASRAEARARNYTLVAPLGLLLVDPASPGNPSPPPPLFAVELAVEGLSSFRLSASLAAAAAPPAQLPTPMVVPKVAFANFTVGGGEAEVFLNASNLGALVLSTATCALEARDAGGALLASTPELLDASPTAVTFTLQTLAATLGRPTRFLGAGTDGNGATTLSRTSAAPYVGNTVCFTPSFWCSDGYSALAVSARNLSDKPSIYGSPYAARWAVAPSGAAVDVVIEGASADLYLSPAPTLREHCAAQAALVGPPALLPRYAHGFHANRWGWTNQSYVEGVLSQFRSGGFPADVFIVRFQRDKPVRASTPKPSHTPLPKPG